MYYALITSWESRDWIINTSAVGVCIDEEAMTDNENGKRKREKWQRKKNIMGKISGHRTSAINWNNRWNSALTSLTLARFFPPVQPFNGSGIDWLVEVLMYIILYLQWICARWIQKQNRTSECCKTWMELIKWQTAICCATVRWHRHQYRIECKKKKERKKMAIASIHSVCRVENCVMGLGFSQNNTNLFM